MLVGREAGPRVWLGRSLPLLIGAMYGTAPATANNKAAKAGPQNNLPLLAWTALAAR